MATSSPTRPATQLSQSEVDTLTNLNATHSPLIRLPRELRDLVLNFVFNFVFTDLLVDTLPKQARFPIYNDYTWAKQLYTTDSLNILFRTCRQILDETHLLPFQLCEFYFDSWEALRTMVRIFMSEQQHAIRRIRLCVSMAFDMWMVVDSGLGRLKGLEGIMLWIKPGLWSRWGSITEEATRMKYREGLRRVLGRSIEVQFE